jgi:hypothetical protein
MKEIHFYKDLNPHLKYPDEYTGIYLTHNETLNAINNNYPQIHTTAISTLNFGWLLDLGYDIYLHENGRTLKVHEGTIDATDKEIRKGHNILRIWIAGVFENYFYE